MLQSQNIQFSKALPILSKSENKNHVNQLGLSKSENKNHVNQLGHLSPVKTRLR